ncbi:MAG: hypothetical protein GKR89_04690 [Candidatus Latescibacteria bacterium]|nr:hypothetical protein [Candidatus Latescibacterota bacterium]
MLAIGIAQTDITPTASVWLTGYGNRDHKSEGVYQGLRAGAVYLHHDNEEILLLTADHIGYDSTYAALAKAAIGVATGLSPRQIVLTATHTHCGPFFTPWCMPGEIEHEYARQLQQQLVHLAIEAQHKAVPGQLRFSRTSCPFGVNRRLPDGQGGILFAPNPDGPMDRDLDTLWFSDQGGRPLGSLSIFGCHPTSLGGYLIGGDYPGFLTRAVAAETGAPALFATGCAGNIRPWFKDDNNGFGRPSYDELGQAGAAIGAQVLATQNGARTIEPALQATATFHPLPYADRPSRDELTDCAAGDENLLKRRWAQSMLELVDAGGLPGACPQEIQLIQLGPDLRAVFLGGEVLAEIGLHIKKALGPGQTIAAAYSNGLIAYIPGQETYDLGGYEVDGSHPYFLRPAPFAKNAESLIVATTRRLAAGL